MKYEARNPGSTRSWSLFVAIAAAAMLLAGCAPSVKVRSDADPDVNLGKYQTYDFFSQLGVEGDSYSNLVGCHFRDAISVQMEARGYSKSDSPQLQVNVSIGAEEKIRVNTYQDPYLYGGYYGRYGYGYMGSPWGYPSTTRTSVSQYTEANIYIDMVDASDKMQEQLRETVYNTVDKVFTQYPVPVSPSQ